MTLPLIYTKKSSAGTKNKIINTVKNHHKDDKKVSGLLN